MGLFSRNAGKNGRKPRRGKVRHNRRVFITHHEMMGDPPFRQRVYALDLRIGDIAWTLYRRFSELRNLKDQLMEQYPNEEYLEYFPANQIFGHSEEFLKTRLTMLEAFLQLTLNSSKIFNCKVVQRFLEVKEARLRYKRNTRPTARLVRITSINDVPGKLFRRTFSVYTIQVKRGNITWSVDRRYSEFWTLRNELLKEFPKEEFLQYVPSPSSSPVDRSAKPLRDVGEEGESLLGKEKASLSSLRKPLLEAFLKLVVDNDSMWTSVCVKSFLQVDAHVVRKTAPGLDASLPASDLQSTAAGVGTGGGSIARAVFRGEKAGASTAQSVVELDVRVRDVSDAHQTLREKSPALADLRKICSLYQDLLSAGNASGASSNLSTVCGNNLAVALMESAELLEQVDHGRDDGGIEQCLSVASTLLQAATGDVPSAVLANHAICRFRKATTLQKDSRDRALSEYIEAVGLFESALQRMPVYPLLYSCIFFYGKSLLAISQLSEGDVSTKSLALAKESFDRILSSTPPAAQYISEWSALTHQGIFNDDTVRKVNAMLAGSVGLFVTYSVDDRKLFTLWADVLGSVATQAPKAAREALQRSAAEKRLIVGFLNKQVPVDMVRFGFLHKKGKAFAEQKMMNWKRRFCVLSGSTLAYYEKADDAEPVGMIELSLVHNVKPVNEHELEDKLGAGQNSTLTIETEGRTFMFVADSADDCSAWIYAITAQIRPTPEAAESVYRELTLLRPA